MSKVTLISYSQPPKKEAAESFLSYFFQSFEKEEETHDTLTDQIAYCARVSNPSNQHNKETSDKLLKYLLKHKHFSPFEMVSACLEITTTRDIARQILRHRSFSFQEFSQRYADPTGDLGFELRDARLQDHKNRQNSIDLVGHRPRHMDISQMFYDDQESIINAAQDFYNKAIKAGIAKEQARAFLPEGLTQSRMYMNGTIRSWIHYIELRTGPETQKEHRIVAKQCAEALEPIFPDIVQFVNNS